MHEDIEFVASEMTLDLRNLSEAAKESEYLSTQFSSALRKRLGTVPDTDVLLTGSIARREVTKDSDCDYLVLSSGTPSPVQIADIFKVVNKKREDLELIEVGSQGYFADFVSSTELFLKIGLDRDSNINTTRRFSVLLESLSVLNEEVRKSTIIKILERYCLQYATRDMTDPITVPRFLANDLIRYWRTIAVDFEAKRWRDFNQGWGLRYAKLLSSRKLLFAGSLVALLLTNKALSGATDSDERYDQLIEYLLDQFEKPPLARLSAAYPHVNAQSRSHIASVLLCYDEILGLLDTRGVRKDIKTSSSSDESHRVTVLSNSIHSSLERIFFEDDLLGPLTKRYSLF